MDIDSWFAAVGEEVDGYLGQLQEVPEMEPGEAMMTLSSIGARLTELTVQLNRMTIKRAQMMMEREIRPLLDGVEFQFKVMSRRAALIQTEAGWARGQF